MRWVYCEQKPSTAGMNFHCWHEAALCPPRPLPGEQLCGNLRRTAFFHQVWLAAAAAAARRLLLLLHPPPHGAVGHAAARRLVDAAAALAEPQLAPLLLRNPHVDLVGAQDEGQHDTLGVRAVFVLDFAGWGIRAGWRPAHRPGWRPG